MRIFQKILKYGLLVYLVGCFFMIVAISNAQDAPYTWEDPLNKVVDSTEYNKDVGGSEGKGRGLVIIGAEFIKDILSLLGIVFVVLAVYAGYLWLTAGGNDEQVVKAKIIIRDVIIGLIIILSAYAITYYILDNLTKATSEEQKHRTGFYLDD